MMREGALLFAACLLLFYLLTYGQAARQGQDIKCGGMCVYACARASVRALCSLLCTKALLMCVPSLPHAACRALVDEMEWAISQVDPKKMIQTGSFRINPDGSQSIREVRKCLLSVWNKLLVFLFCFKCRVVILLPWMKLLFA